MTQAGFPRSTPEEQGIASPAIVAFLDAMEEKGLELHGFMLLRNGFVTAEGWWKPYVPERPHIMFSVTKTFAATAVGMAQEEGLLSVNDPVLSYFPDESPENPSEHLQSLLIKDLLRMGTGQAKDTIPAGPDDMDWIKTFLHEPVEHAPGTRFAYHSGASNMLSAIIRRATGQNLHDYLKPRLFAPLGIEGEQWQRLPDGTVAGGYGLRVKTEDLAKLGQLYLQKGVWNGERLLSEAWVEEATAKQISNGTEPDNDWHAGYGYQLWRCARDNAYRFIGMFNQLCLVLPEHNAIVAVTSGLSDEKAVLDMVWEHLVPGMSEEALPDDTASRELLAERLDGLSLMPQGRLSADRYADLADGRAYELEQNELKWRSVAFGKEAGGMSLTIVTESGHNPLPFNSETYTEGVYDGEPVAVTGGWLDERTLAVTSHMVTSAFTRTMTFRFGDDRLALDITGNVGMWNGPISVEGALSEQVAEGAGNAGE